MQNSWNTFFLTLFLLFAVAESRADTYRDDNYRPSIDMPLEQTNLPIVFIDTRCGDTITHAIHEDYRIAVRMKIINNPDSINYGDTIVHPNQKVDYEGWVAIRYRGNSLNDWNKKKPYNFKTLKSANINGDKQKTKVLDMPKDHTWLILPVYGDRTILRDVMMFQLARSYFDYIPRCRYCEVILDGVYYGIYVLSENIRKGENRLDLDDPGLSGDELTGGYLLQIDREDEPHFTSKYKAVDGSGNVYLAYNQIFFQYKHPDIEEMDSLQIEYIQRRMDRMEDVLASDGFTDPDTGYRQYLDPMSFIDQQLSQEFSGNVDGYRLSGKFFKRRDSQDPRFKCVLWDMNLAYGNSNYYNGWRTDLWIYQSNDIMYPKNESFLVPFWWYKLNCDSTYTHLFKRRWAQYRHANLEEESLMAVVDSLANVLTVNGAMSRNSRAWPRWGKYVWPNYFVANSFQEEIDFLKQWLHNRLVWMDEQLEYDPTAPIFIPGDVNDDGEVTVGDVNAIIRVILGAVTDDGIIERADVNGDGEITVSDINAVIKIIIGS